MRKGDSVWVRVDARWYRLDVGDEGYLGEAGDPWPVTPTVGEVRLPMRDVDKAWYEATRRFGPYNVHPTRCEDWNLESGGNTDLGEVLVAPFDGLVLAAADYGGGVGKVIQVLGRRRDGELLVWAGWHLQAVYVQPGEIVSVGYEIGAIGNAGGRYKGAHLHEQVCVVGRFGIPAPTTFADDRRYDFRQPSAEYVRLGVDAELVARVAAFDGR